MPLMAIEPWPAVIPPLLSLHSWFLPPLILLRPWVQTTVKKREDPVADQTKEPDDDNADEDLLRIQKSLGFHDRVSKPAIDRDELRDDQIVQAHPSISRSVLSNRGCTAGIITVWIACHLLAPSVNEACTKSLRHKPSIRSTISTS